MSKELKAPDKVTQKMTRDGGGCGKPYNGRNDEYQRKTAGGKLFSPPQREQRKKRPNRNRHRG